MKKIDGKNIIFDWFTLFKFDDKFILGRPRFYAGRFIMRLILSGWKVYVIRPNIVYPCPDILRHKVLCMGIKVFEILYDLRRIDRVSFSRGVYIDVGYFYLLGGLWVLLWLRCLRRLRKVLVK